MGEHAPLPPSGAPQWGNCTGSIAAQAAFPNLDSDETREGTAAHWVMDEALRSMRRLVSFGAAREATLSDFYLERTAPNGVLITEKIIAGVQVIVDDVAEVCDRFNAWHLLLIEQRVYVPEVHEQNWGTLDVALYLPDRSLLFLWDYKNGRRECRARGNLQLIDYLGGLINRFGINGQDDQRIRVVARIVQPFFYSGRGPIDEWTFYLAEIRGELNRLHGKANEVYANATLTTGLWCRDCLAVGVCSAARAENYNFIHYANRPYAMDAMTVAELALEREILAEGVAIARARVEAIEADLHHRITNGEADSGLTLESSPGRLEWMVEPTVAAAALDQFGVDIRVPAVKTPTQAIEAAPSSVRAFVKTVLKSITRRPPGALQLVKAADSRTARAFTRKPDNATV